MRIPSRDAEFTEFVAAHRQRLLRAARLLTAGDDGHAEDLVQASLTKLYLAWPRVRRAEHPLSYAHRVLTNTFIDDTRRLWRQRETSHADPAAGHDPVAESPDLDIRDAVLSALAGLTPSQRAVVVLRHWLDLDVAATAAALGCSSGNVKSTNSRALAHLRTALADLTEDISEGRAS